MAYFRIVQTGQNCGETSNIAGILDIPKIQMKPVAENNNRAQLFWKDERDRQIKTILALRSCNASGQKSGELGY
jgi:hypothetical protein